MRLLVALLALALTGCAIQPQVATPGAASSQPAVTPTYDNAPSGYISVPQQACLVADLDGVWIDRPQGRMIAWAPGENRLAYISTQRSSGWYLGDLRLVAGPDYTQSTQVTQDVRVNGSLAWSPGGDSLAFVALREDQLYTVMITRADGSGLVDLFPADLARTDQFSSLKSVTGWQSDDTLRVSTSCGAYCRQTVDYSAASAARVYSPETENGTVEATLATDSPPPPAIGSLFTDIVLFSAAPDGKQFAFSDSLGKLWVVSTGTRRRFEVSLDNREVFELAWSPDSSALAVHADDRVLVFSLPCDPQAE
jgi:Tol biopolymer transport system component